MIVQQENLLANIEEDMISQEDLLRKLKDISAVSYTHLE